MKAKPTVKEFDIKVLAEQSEANRIHMHLVNLCDMIIELYPEVKEFHENEDQVRKYLIGKGLLCLFMFACQIQGIREKFIECIRIAPNLDDGFQIKEKEKLVSDIENHIADDNEITTVYKEKENESGIEIFSEIKKSENKIRKHEMDIEEHDRRINTLEKIVNLLQFEIEKHKAK